MDSKTLALIVKGIDEASATLKDVKGEVKDLGSEASTTSRDLQPLGRGLSAVGAAGAALISITALTAARVEVLGTVLYTVGETAGYTEGQLDALEAGVTNLGITTGAARQGLVQMMQAELDLAEATDIASIAQDAAVIANVNSSAAYETLVRGILTGRSVLLKSLGLTVDFNAAYKRQAELLGKSTLELTANEKMTARLNEVKRAGAIIEGTYEAAMGDVGKKLTSMPRLLEEAAVALGQAYLPAMEGGVDATSDMLKAFIALEPEQLKGTANFIAIATATTGFGGALILVLPKIAAMKTAMTALNMTMLGPVGLVAGGLAAVYAITQLPVPLENATNSLATLEEASKLLEPELYAAAEAERAVRDEAKRLREETHGLADGWTGRYSPALIAAREQTTGWESALLGVRQPLRDVARDTQDLTGIVSDYSFELDLLKGAISGPVAKANEDYLAQIGDVRQAIRDEQTTLQDLRLEHGLYDEAVLASQEKIDGLEGELLELAGQHEDTINRILHGMILQQLAIDGMTEAEMQYALDSARELGLVDEAYYDLAAGVIDSFAKSREEGILPAIGDLVAFRDQAAETTSQASLDYTAMQETIREESRVILELGLNPVDSALKGITTDIGKMEGRARGVGESMSRQFAKATPGLDEILGRIAQIPRSIPINVHTTYTEEGIPPWQPEGPPAPTPPLPPPYAPPPPPGGGGPPEHQFGTPYVPYTGYAYLHEGEAVLTREENRRRGEGGMRVTVINNFGRESVRTDEDIQLIIEQIQLSTELQGTRDRVG